MKSNPFSLIKDAEILQRIALAVVIITISFAMEATSGGFFTAANLDVMVMNLIFEAIMAIGMTLVIVAGGIDLSVSSVFPFAGILVAKMTVEAGWSLPVSVTIALVACATIGFINGYLINCFRVHPLIITMGMMLALRGTNLAITDGHSIGGFSDQFTYLGQGKLLGAEIPIWFFVIMACVFGYLLKHHRAFRQLYFIGGAERAARLSGINVARVKIGVYIISAVLAGAAGVMGAATYGAADWGNGTGSELKAIAAVAIGGANINGGSGTMIGTVLGALFLAVVHNVFVSSSINTFWYDVVNGVMLLLAVLISRFVSYRSFQQLLKIRQQKIDRSVPPIVQQETKAT